MKSFWGFVFAISLLKSLDRRKAERRVVMERRRMTPKRANGELMASIANLNDAMERHKAKAKVAA